MNESHRVFLQLKHSEQLGIMRFVRCSHHNAGVWTFLQTAWRLQTAWQVSLGCSHLTTQSCQGCDYLTPDLGEVKKDGKRKNNNFQWLLKLPKKGWCEQDFSYQQQTTFTKIVEQRPLQTMNTIAKAHKEKSFQGYLQSQQQKCKVLAAFFFF